jgi:hypothetical protein
LALAWPAAGLSQRKLCVTASPSYVILGGAEPETVSLQIEVREAQNTWAESAQVVLHATAGTITGLRRTEPGRFRAELRPPQDRFPQLALVHVAEVSSVVRGEPPVLARAVVAYGARVDLRGRAEPDSEMKVRVAKRWFGPRRVNRDGGFSIPVIVPPGTGWAEGEATDELGNASHSKINLYLPAVQRLHTFAYPELLLADGRDQGWLFVSTVDPSGAPRDANLSLATARGKLAQGEALEPGLWRYAYTAPSELADGTDRVVIKQAKKKRNAEAEAAENDSESEVVLRLLAGAPTEVTARVDPPLPAADGQTAVNLQVTLRDERGNAGVGHEVMAMRGTETLRLKETNPGDYGVTLPPQSQVGTEALQIAIIPRTTFCPRPWAALAADRTMRVRDVRGISCRLGVLALGPHGDMLWRGSTSDMGELKLPAEISAADVRLVVEEAPTGAPDVLWSKDGIIKEPAGIKHLSLPLTWRLPSQVGLALGPPQRDAERYRATLAIFGIPAEQVAARISVKASRGSATLAQQKDGSWQVEVGTASGPVDVVAADRDSGVAAWLHVD